MKHTDMLRLTLFVLAGFGLLVSLAHGDVAVERHFAGPDRIYSIDSRADMLAIGTDVGLLIGRGADVAFFTVEHGLPGNRVRHAIITEDTSLFLGIMGPHEFSEQSFYRAWVQGDTIAVEDITPAEGFEHADAMVALGRGGGLWVGDGDGLNRFDGLVWERCEWPAGFWPYYSRRRVAVDADGGVWGIEGIGQTRLFRLRDREWTFFDELQDALAVSTDDDGNVWVANREPPGLWRYDGAEWDSISSSNVWGEIAHGKEMFLEVSGDGAVWGIADDYLVRCERGTTSMITEACGLPFTDRWDPSFFGCAEGLSSGVMLLGTLSQGLLVCDGQDFTRIHCGAMPGNEVLRAEESSDGSLWLETSHSYYLGRLCERNWQQFYAPWLQYYTEWAPFVNDIGGAMWLSGETCMARVQNESFSFYDSRDFGCEKVRSPAVDKDGVLWFCGSFNECPALSFDGETWTEHPEASRHEETPVVHEIVIGPGDVKWFENMEGYTSFDGQNWTYYRSGIDIPYKHDEYSYATHLAFDLESRAIIYGERGVFRQLKGDGWEKITNDWVQHLKIDSGGSLWLAVYSSGLFCGKEGDWKRLTNVGGLSSDFVTCIAIDHNGDKWVGTEYGLNRIEDGGPAQQKFELAVDEAPDGYLTVRGTFTNAGAVIPVLLWLACGHDGALYYYPAWGPTPEGMKRVLGAYSVKTEELVRLDTSTLPPGDYTFYGGISLLGGMDLLIGARGAKIAVTTYHKE